MPSNVIRASAIYPCRLLSGVFNFFITSTVFFYNEMSTRVSGQYVTIHRYVSKEKKVRILTIQAHLTFTTEILKWRSVRKNVCVKWLRTKTAHKKRKRMSQGKNNDRHKFARILSYMLTRFLHGLLDIHVSGDTKIRRCLHV